MTIIDLLQNLSDDNFHDKKDLLSYLSNPNEMIDEVPRSAFTTPDKDTINSFEINRKCIVGILRSMNENKDNRRKYMKTLALRPDGYAPKMYKEKFYGYPSIWPKTLILDSINIKGHKFLPLTAIFDDEVVFFMHIDLQRAKGSPVLENMNFITGDPESIFAVFHKQQSKSSMRLEFQEGNICFNRRLLTSYQGVANYLATKLTVNLNPQRNKRKFTWNTIDENGRIIAFSKREAIDYARNNKGIGKSMSMYTDGRVAFFANPKAKVVFPDRFACIEWNNLSGEIEDIMKCDDWYGEFIFSSKNVSQYLNAHYA